MMKRYFVMMKIITIKLHDNGEHEIVADSIYCLLSDGNYIHVYYEKGNVAGHIHALGSLKALLFELPKSFRQYNRFAIINYAKLAVIERGEILIFRSGFSIEIKTKYGRLKRMRL